MATRGKPAERALLVNRGDGCVATQSVLIATCSTLTADLNPTGRMSTQHAPEEQPTEEATRTPERIISQRLPGTNGELRTRARFLRGDCLGRGSFARAYQLTELETSGSSSPIATKVLLKREVDVAKVAAEVALHRSLSHPHIVTCFDTFEDTAYLYLLLELCDLTAMHLLKQHGPLAVPCAARLVSQAARALGLGLGLGSGLGSGIGLASPNPNPNPDPDPDLHAQVDALRAHGPACERAERVPVRGRGRISG